MKGEMLLKANIQGNICTNSNRMAIRKWRNEMERDLVSLHLPKIGRRKICVTIKMWIYQSRLQLQRNDLDNLVKPILDTMKRIRIIEDDADVFHLETTKFPTTSEEEVQIVVRGWH